MKPSERIARIAKELLADVERRAHPHNFAKYRDVYVEKCFTRAVVWFLDEAFGTNMLPPTAAAVADRTAVAKLARVLAEVHIGDGDGLGDVARELHLLLGPDEEPKEGVAP